MSHEHQEQEEKFPLPQFQQSCKHLEEYSWTLLGPAPSTCPSCWLCAALSASCSCLTSTGHGKGPPGPCSAQQDPPDPEQTPGRCGPFAGWRLDLLQTPFRTPTNKLQLNRLPPAPPLPCQSLAATASSQPTHTAWPVTSRALLALQHHSPHAQRREKQSVCSYSQF